MLFNSSVFAIFFALVFIGYWSLRGPKSQNILLLVASMVFYGWWDVRFLPLIYLSVVIDYTAGLKISAAREGGGRGRGWLITSIVTNLSVLGYFKYCNFFISNLEPVWEAFGWNPGTLNIILPMGISFYTFQTMSYTIDVYRGKCPPCRSMLLFATYVSFFPQLVAGPIERATSLMPQLMKARKLTASTIRVSLLLILLGYLKKVLIADNLALVVDSAFGRIQNGFEVSGGDMLVGVYAFAFQLYCDFSGYSDIALGVAGLLGVRLMVNFKQPLLACSVTDFWRRWHISLSLWLRDYLYIPLGGSRKGQGRTYINLMATMLIGGLWHGASWVFVVWGGIHGSALALERVLGIGNSGTQPSGVRRLVGWVWTFHVFVFSMCFFRADSLASSMKVLATVAGISELPRAWPTSLLFIGIALILLVDLPYRRNKNHDYRVAIANSPLLIALTMGAFAYGLLLIPPGTVTRFIYFQF